MDHQTKRPLKKCLLYRDLRRCSLLKSPQLKRFMYGTYLQSLTPLKLAPMVLGPPSVSWSSSQ